jgi:hypothetical protein
LHKRGWTNLGGEGETKVVQEVTGIEAALVDSIISLHVTAYYLELTRAEN